MKTILTNILNKPYVNDAGGEPIEEAEVVIDITYLKPQEIFKILNFKDEVLMACKYNSPEMFFVLFRSDFKVTVPGVHEVYIKGIEGNKLIFGGFLHEDGTGEVKIEIPYVNMYPKGFSASIVTKHHLMEEFYRKVLGAKPQA